MQNCPFPPGIWIPIIIHGSWAHLSSHPTRHLDRFSRFCSAHYCDRLTDHDNRLHLASAAMRPKNVRTTLNLFHCSIVIISSRPSHCLNNLPVALIPHVRPSNHSYFNCFSWKEIKRKSQNLSILHEFHWIRNKPGALHRHNYHVSSLTDERWQHWSAP